MAESTSLIKSTPGLLKLLHENNTSLDVFRRDMLALSCLIAGTSYQKLKEIEPELLHQTVFELKRESENEFDKKGSCYFLQQK